MGRPDLPWSMWVVIAICAVDVAWLITALTFIGVRRLIAARRFRRHLAALQVEADELIRAASLARLLAEEETS